jgi:hypothetical protein
VYDLILDVNVLFLESVKCGLEGMEITVMTSLRFSHMLQCRSVNYIIQLKLHCRSVNYIIQHMLISL